MNIVSRSVAIAAAVLLSGSAAVAQSGGGYDLHWNTPAAGGQAMSGGAYALHGTAGQTASIACEFSAARYQLRSGFWAARSGGDVVFRAGFETGC